MKVYHLDETHYGVKYGLANGRIGYKSEECQTVFSSMEKLMTHVNDLVGIYNGSKIGGKQWKLIKAVEMPKLSSFYILPVDYNKHRDEMDCSIPLISLFIREFVVDEVWGGAT